MQGKHPLEPDSTTARILQAAIRAPSGDNCQPWRFRLQGAETIEVHSVAGRAKSFFDYGGRGTRLSVGGVLENMRIQAAGEGVATEISYDAGDALGGLEATVRLTPDANAMIPAARVDAMLRRTVNRRPFLPRRPAQHRLDAVLDDPVDGVHVTVIDRRRDIRQWSRLIYLADRIRYTHPVIHTELFDKILFSQEQADEKRIGLEIDRLGAGPAAASIMRFLQPWDRMQRLQRYWVDRALSNQSRFLGLSSGAMVLLGIPDDTPRSWIRAGEQMERMWVLAEEQGLCVHPMTVVLFLIQRYRDQGAAEFLPQHRPILEEMDKELRGLLGDRTGTMLFRLGTAWRMKDVSVRMPLDSFLGE